MFCEVLLCVSFGGVEMHTKVTEHQIVEQMRKLIEALDDRKRENKKLIQESKKMLEDFEWQP